MSQSELNELGEILMHYDLGRAVGSELNDRGFVNTSYSITTVNIRGERKTFFLRKYKPGIKEEELIFEHTLIRHLYEKGVCPVAWVYPTREGKSYYGRQEAGEDLQFRYYAIFDFLPGEDRYTWVYPCCSTAEIKNSAAVLARFHSALIDLVPQGKRYEAKILDLLPQILKSLKEIPGRSKGTIFDVYLLEYLDLILENLYKTLEVLNEPDSHNMPQMPIHCDYHPGNLKFEGDEITALFDFDWSKVDYRCFDIGLALFYFFASWEAEDGCFRLPEAALFLKAYQETMQEYPSPGPMGKNELKNIPYMISAANLYVLNWTLVDFYNKEVDPEEYLVYLAHAVEFIKWFSGVKNLSNLESMVGRLSHLTNL
jgi:homoserine kinase type II